MQIVESSGWALRTARLSLTSPRSDIRITLFPMLHVGVPASSRSDTAPIPG
jgi:hypothetical protein